MKTKKKCSVCSIRFKATRSDAMYCSNACKQKAHTTRKREPAQSQKRIFYIDEYASLCELWGREPEFFPLIFFCFLRAGLEENPSRAAFDRYFDGVWSPDTYLEMIATKAYKSFQEDFLAGKFLVVEKLKS